MTPPEAPKDGSATTGETPPAASSCLNVIKVRKDFVAASRARRQGTKSMMVQARERRDGEPHDPQAVRVGFTCSKKVGNAVARNRGRRRQNENKNGLKKKAFVALVRYAHILALPIPRSGIAPFY